MYRSAYPLVRALATGLAAWGVAACADDADALESNESACFEQYEEFYAAPDSSAALLSSLGLWHAARVRELRTTEANGAQQSCESYDLATAPRVVEVLPDGTFRATAPGDTTSGTYVVVAYYEPRRQDDTTAEKDSTLAFWRVVDVAGTVAIPSIVPGEPYADGGGTDYEGQGVRGNVTYLMSRD